MQTEINNVTTKVKVQILGVNQFGHQSGSSTFVLGRFLPWLEEGQNDMVWQAWNVTYRDVIILDGENRPVAVYNLSANDLAVAANYAALKKLLIDTANK